ncbi:MAG: hypothetical protein ACRCT6_01540 [Notoacmeibacter sp.]
MSKANVSQPTDPNRPLGRKAEGRKPVDLLTEARRLKFSEGELKELRRLYEADLNRTRAMPANKQVETALHGKGQQA